MNIHVSSLINASLAKVWEAWTTPEDILNWNAASEDWHTTRASNDLRVGGQFSSRMEAKDASMGFDFTGTYTQVIDRQLIEYVIADGRKVTITFTQTDNGVEVSEHFEAENQHPAEMQRQGWQSILDNFTRYVERL